MEKLSPKEFAALLRKTYVIREGSWNGNKYTLTFDQAAMWACIELRYSRDWVGIASVTILPGYADIWDWCEEVER